MERLNYRFSALFLKIIYGRSSFHVKFQQVAHYLILCEKLGGIQICRLNFAALYNHQQPEYNDHWKKLYV